MRIAFLLLAVGLLASSAQAVDPRACSAFRRLAQVKFTSLKGAPTRVDASSASHIKVSRGRDTVDVESSFTDDQGQVHYTHVLFLRRHDGQWQALRTSHIAGGPTVEDQWVQPDIPYTSATQQDYRLEKGPIRAEHLNAESRRLKQDYSLSDEAITQAYQDLRKATLAEDDAWVPQVGVYWATELACLREGNALVTQRLLEGARSLHLTPEQVAAHLDGQDVTQNLVGPQQTQYLYLIEIVRAALEMPLKNEVRPLVEQIKKAAKAL